MDNLDLTQVIVSEIGVFSKFSMIRLDRMPIGAIVTAHPVDVLVISWTLKWLSTIFYLLRCCRNRTFGAGYSFFGFSIV